MIRVNLPFEGLTGGQMLIVYEQTELWCQMNVSITSYYDDEFWWRLYSTYVEFKDPNDAIRFKLGYTKPNFKGYIQ